MSSGLMPSGDPVTSPAPARSRVRKDIEGLRAVAVGLVILDHIVHWPAGGFIGVDVFFVISGFLITSLLLKEVRRDGKVSFADFYRRRARRILPNSVLVIAVTVAVAAVVMPTSRIGAVLTDGWWALLFAGNWRMASSGTDYLQGGLPPSPLQHFWSLGVEEQFYLVWPVLLLVALAASAVLPRWIGRTWCFGAACAAVLVASLAWSWHETVSATTVAYFSSLSRAWELAIGAMLAIVAHRLDRIPERLRAPLGLLGLAGIVASALLITPDSRFPTPAVIAPVLATALVIAAGTGGGEPSRLLWPLTNPASQYVGKLSFSLYLWHFPVATLLVYLMADGTPAYLATAVVLTAALSIGSFYLVEDPIRRSSWLEPGERGRGRPRARLPLAVVATVTVGCLVAAVWQVNRTDQQPVIDTALADAVGGSCFGAPALDAGTEACPPSATTVPAADAASRDQEESTGPESCWAGEDVPLEACVLGSSDPDAKRVALIGDSHAAMMVPAMTRVAQERGWQLTVYTGYGCQWRVNVGESCREGVESAARDFVEGEPFDLVVTTSARWVVKGKTERPQEYADRWRPVIDRGTPVVAIADTPTVTGEALACLQRVTFDPRTDTCSTPRDRAEEDYDALPEAARETPGAGLVDLTDQFCTAKSCPSVIGSVIVYRDTFGHITDTYSRTLAPVLGERLEAAFEDASAS
jgi:peptidoglycan/LPS O-acetylase OafA/YrhL